MLIFAVYSLEILLKEINLNLSSNISDNNSSLIEMRNRLKRARIVVIGTLPLLIVIYLQTIIGSIIKSVPYQCITPPVLHIGIFCIVEAAIQYMPKFIDENNLSKSQTITQYVKDKLPNNFKKNNSTSISSQQQQTNSPKISIMSN